VGTLFNIFIVFVCNISDNIHCVHFWELSSHRIGIRSDFNINMKIPTSYSVTLISFMYRPYRYLFYGFCIIYSYCILNGLKVTEFWNSDVVGSGGASNVAGEVMHPPSFSNFSVFTVPTPQTSNALNPTFQFVAPPLVGGQCRIAPSFCHFSRFDQRRMGWNKSPAPLLLNLLWNWLISV